MHLSGNDGVRRAIIGYCNEALEGLTQVSRTGWVTPLNQPLKLAERIASLYKTPSEIVTAAFQSLAFARDHTFEKTFQGRVEHLDRVAASLRSVEVTLARATWRR